MWILTRSENDYNQHGDYFVDYFKTFPCVEDLKQYGINREEAEHILAGGGRRGYEDTWYHLFKAN